MNVIAVGFYIPTVVIALKTTFLLETWNCFKIQYFHSYRNNSFLPQKWEEILHQRHLWEEASGLYRYTKNATLSFCKIQTSFLESTLSSQTVIIEGNRRRRQKMPPLATEKRAKMQRKAVEKAAKKAEASTTAKRSSAK